MKIIVVHCTFILALFVFVALPKGYGQEVEEETPPSKKQYPIFKDTPPHELQLSSFPSNKFKSFVGGYGLILWAFKAEVPQGNDSTESVVTSHGISVGFKDIDNFYNSKIPIEIGMYYSVNLLMSFAASAINNNEDFGLKSEFFKEDEAIKQIAPNFTIGPHISIPNDYITTQLGLGISAGFLFHHLFYEENKFYLTIGVGPAIDLEFLFRFSYLFGVSVAVQFTWYPLLMDSLHERITYTSTTVVLGSIQVGMLVLSY